ncbi:uncharacterized protein LY89DRAFT_727703 [Mollisia scopiformis]|uniref:Uncharacterized protein n=1 Tax=Mollisia scopiformis TaxID=149040 RepID=A0A194XWK8_MOLSC|nr:uncharacterized protein LY89DRAFT_727703 [Mollisia scopiformis]KUJ24685.1 hypothetical protein LY89DRAFT_727703 [Mollisia scopiformis]
MAQNSLTLPATLVYEGREYSRSGIKPFILTIELVEVVPFDEDDTSEDLPEPAGYGPQQVVFGGVLYFLESTPPHEIEDSVLRTVEKDVALQQAQVLQPQPQPLQAAPPPRLANQHFPANRGFSTGPTNRAMPARARVTTAKKLPYLFDIPASQQAGIQVITPSQSNPVVRIVNGKRMRARWTNEHTQYLDELIWLGMLLTNRRLEVRDFQAVTEALHRRFRGTPDYTIRGWNTVHSYATRRPTYPKFVNHVLSLP